MIKCPFCSVHQELKQLTCVGGTWQFICPFCEKTPLTYSTTTESNMKDVKKDDPRRVYARSQDGGSPNS